MGWIAGSVVRGLHLLQAGGAVGNALAQFETGNWFGGLVSVADAGANLYLGTKACFVPGTMVVDGVGGLKAIEDVVEGGSVLSRPEEDPDGVVEPKVVERHFRRLGRVVMLHLEGGAVLGTTGEHPFWVQGRGWTACKDLEPGQRVRTRFGWKTVEEVFDTGEIRVVYNVRVAGYHTYFVGGDGDSVWVHNSYTPDQADVAECIKQRQAGKVDWNSINPNLTGSEKSAIRAAARAQGVDVPTPSPNGRNGNQPHIDDVTRNNTQPSGELGPEPVGSRVPDGVGQVGQKVVIRGVEIDPGPNGRVIVEVEPFSGNIPASGGRTQIRDMRASDRLATIVVTDPHNTSLPPLIYPPGTQPPPSGHYRGG